ncbi:MAG: FliI/YscN family ATPase [Phycisphaerales bacterium]|nr:FliI/YscN family ATPase [Phycisphaerales bacterium]
MTDPKRARLESILGTTGGPDRIGAVASVTGPVLRGRLPGARMGEICRIHNSDGILDAEVVGFDEHGVIMMPLGTVDGVEYQARIEPRERAATTPVGTGVVGRVMDALGRPIDGRGPLGDVEMRPLIAPPPPAMTRQRITQTLETGVRAIDGLLTIGHGQRMGLFAGPGVGKSTLLATFANRAKADLIVIALIGERGREVRAFLEDNLDEEGLARTATVVSTSDEPPLLRLRAAHAATAIAEWGRDQGMNVLLLMDSVTRFARALRDVGLAAGEVPGRQGFPPSVFTQLPVLLERTGPSDRGTITAIYTVLTPAGDLSDPLADETMSILDGHLILTRALSERTHYPAIDVRQSTSRLMSELVDERHAEIAGRARRIISCYERNYDKISLSIFDPESDEERDDVDRYPAIERVLKQASGEQCSLEETLNLFEQAAGA